MTPPNDISDSDLFTLLASEEMPWEAEVFPIAHPKTKQYFSYAIQPLGHEEMKIVKMVAKGRAEAAYKGKDYDQTFKDEIYADELIVEILFRTSKKLEDRSQKLFDTPNWISKNLSTDVIGTMYNNYEVTKLRVGVNIFEMSETDRQAWISRLAEGAGKDSEGFLGRLNLFVAKKCLLDTVLELINAQATITSLNAQLENLSQTSKAENPETSQISQS